MAGFIYKATSDTWDEEVLNEGGLVLVVFWALWCSPCRMLSPIIEEISDEYNDKLKVIKINSDENPDIADKYDVKGVPNLIFFRDGKKIDRIVGTVSKSQLIRKINEKL